MMGSLRRITAVAGNTFLEAVRQKVFAVLLVFALVLIFRSKGRTESFFPSPVEVLFACRSKEGRIGAFDFRGD